MMIKKKFFQVLAVLLLVPGSFLAGAAAAAALIVLFALAALLLIGFAVFVSAGFALAAIFDALEQARRFWKSFRGSAPKTGTDDDRSRPASSKGAAFPEESFEVEGLRREGRRWLQ